MHIISNLHEFCRLHPLIQGPTFSSVCNIAFLAGNQNCSFPDLAWTDKMCVCTFYMVMMIKTGQGRYWGLFLFCSDAAKTLLLHSLTLQPHKYACPKAHCTQLFLLSFFPPKYSNKFRSKIVITHINTKTFQRCRRLML